MDRYFTDRESRRELDAIFYNHDMVFNLSGHVKIAHPNYMISTYAREISRYSGSYSQEVRTHLFYVNKKRYLLGHNHLMVDHNVG